MTNSTYEKTPKRFVLHVGSDGKVAITCGDEAVFQKQKPLASIGRWLNDVEGIRSSPPSPTGQENAFLWMLCDDATELDQIWGAYDRIYNKDRHDDTDLKTIGRFLFEKLIGTDAWQAMVGDAAPEGPGNSIELAFQFDKSLEDLHRFNWELMCRDDAFLARKWVAFTHLVEPKTKAEGEEKGERKLVQFPRPPKVLFVVGSSYTDDQVRPGAEYYALMRQLEKDGHTIHSRVLQRANPDEIRAVMKSWRPGLVHFICHGGVGADSENRVRGYLELQTENKKDSVPRFADGLLADLGAGGTLPTIVVLSACHSASLPEAGDIQTWSGAAHTGSLASELVAGGVPFVVGMGGSVSDVACRLFSRRFGQAIVAGESLVTATAEGRWSAFVDRLPKTIDWALPTLFMATDVDAGFVPVECKEGGEDPGITLNARMERYGVPHYPVFCARHKFFDCFYELISESPSARRVLLIQTASTTEGIGRHRLLQELAAQALREGHVPILISSKKSRWEPTTVARLAVCFLRAVAAARTAFGLEPRMDECALLGLMREEIPYDRYETDRIYPVGTRLERILKWIEGGVDDVGDILDATIAADCFQSEIHALLDELRQPPARIGKDGMAGRAVAMLNQVHMYGDATISSLFSELISSKGFCSKDEPVPVILCYSKEGLSDATLKEKTEGKGILWLQEELGPFSQENDEDMLVYQQVMLNLDSKDLSVRDLSKKVRQRFKDDIEGEELSFAYNPWAKAEVVQDWTEKFRDRIKGMPRLLDDAIMYLCIEDAVSRGDVDLKERFLIAADDETRLRKLRE